MQDIDTIFSKFNTDKNKYFHNYSRQYEQLLHKYRNTKIKYLEIGVFEGQSLLAMREVFENATHIVGVDINHKCKQYENLPQNIFVEIGDATSQTFLDILVQKYGQFDIILDDGSHTNVDVIKTFEALFPLLKDDGLYIVEDTICYKSKNHIDNNYSDHLSYFFKYTPYLNQWRYDDSTEGIKDNCIDPFKIMKRTDNPFEYGIDRIEYGCSYIAIHKKIRYNWIL